MKIGILPAIGLIGLAIMIAGHEQKIKHLEQRIDVLEHQYGVRVDGMDYQIFKLFPPTNER